MEEKRITPMKSDPTKVSGLLLWEQLRSEAVGGGGGSRTKTDKADVERKYIAMKKSGESNVNLDKYLKGAIAVGLITQDAATELREKRW